MGKVYLEHSKEEVVPLNFFLLKIDVYFIIIQIYKS